MKKARYLVSGLVTVIISFLLAACGNGSSSEDLTRSDYVGMLGETFGYSDYITATDRFSDVTGNDPHYAEIQALSEWGILPESGEFDPDSDATLSFILETAVKAIGVDDIVSSGAEIDPDDPAAFYATNIAAIDISDIEQTVSKESAQQIIDYAYEYKQNLVIPQVVDIELNETVKEIGSDIVIDDNGEAATITGGSDYKVGDVIYSEGDNGTPPVAKKIVAIDGLEAKLEDASVEETYAHVSFSGTFENGVIGATSASDQTSALYGNDLFTELNAHGIAAGDVGGGFVPMKNGVSVSTTSNSAAFVVDFSEQSSDGNGSIHGKAVIAIKDIKVTAKYDSPWYKPLDPNEVSMNLSYNTEISSEIDGHYNKSIPLGTVDFNVAGPVYVQFKFIAKIGADGEISVSCTSSNNYYAGWKKGAGLVKKVDSSMQAGIEADVTLTAEVTGKADLRIGVFSASESIINAQATTGLIAIAKLDVDLLGDQPTCIDVQMYVPLRWGVNQDGCIVTSIGNAFGADLSYKATVWDAESSKFKWHLHWEDGARTPNDECTRGDAVEQELVKEDGTPLTEYDLFEFEELEFDFIELSANAIYLDVDEVKDVPILSLPEGCYMDDLSYEVADGKVCTVSGGRITAKAPGSTIVKIRTNDGMFAVSLAVTVRDSYEIEGGFVGL